MDIDELNNKKIEFEDKVNKLNDEIGECEFEYLATRLDEIKQKYKKQNDEYEKVKKFKFRK